MWCTGVQTATATHPGALQTQTVWTTTSSATMGCVCHGQSYSPVTHSTVQGWGVAAVGAGAAQQSTTGQEEVLANHHDEELTVFQVVAELHLHLPHPVQALADRKVLL